MIAHCERAVQRVVEGQVRLVVEAHRPAPGEILRHHVGEREAVHQAAIDLAVRAVPRVIEVGNLTVVRLVEGANRAAAGVGRVGIVRAGWLRGSLRLALEMEPAEVGVERAVFLHQHDDVVDRRLGRIGG